MTSIQVSQENELHLAYLKWFNVSATVLHNKACDAVILGKTEEEENLQGALVTLVGSAIVAKCLACRGASSKEREVLEQVGLENWRMLLRNGYKIARDSGALPPPNEFADADNEVDQIWVDESRRVIPQLHYILENTAGLTMAASMIQAEVDLRKTVIAVTRVHFFMAANICRLVGNIEGELDNRHHIGSEKEYQHVLDSFKETPFRHQVDLK